MLVVWCGLIAKWLKERVRAGAGEYFFLSSGLISVVDNFIFVGSVVSSKCVTVTYEYSIDNVLQRGLW